MKKITPKNLLIIALLFLFATVSFASGPGALATVTKVKGAPSVIKTGQTNADALKIGDVIETGDSVITDQDSKATLLFNDGEIRVITSGSNVKFSEGGQNENLTSVARVTTTLADALNARNLDKTFESVTGVKLSLGGEEKRKSEAPKEAYDSPSGKITTPAKSSQSDDNEITPPEQAAPSVTAGAPAPPPLDEEKSLSPVQRATSTKPSTEAHKNWGNWLDDSASVAIAHLLPPEALKDMASISIAAGASTPRTLSGVADSLALSNVSESPIKVKIAVSYKNGNSKILNIILKTDEDAKLTAEKELIMIKNLKSDDLETYLYLKASILKRNEFYIAALGALSELENLHPGVLMPHVIKSRAIIYHKMGEAKLSFIEAAKLKL